MPLGKAGKFDAECFDSPLLNSLPAAFNNAKGTSSAAGNRNWKPGGKLRPDHVMVTESGNCGARETQTVSSEGTIASK